MKSIYDIPAVKTDLESELVAVFREIWNERKHVSEVSGKELPFNFAPGMFHVFSHLHSRGSCPALKLHKGNIWLMTAREHSQWEFERETLKERSEWKKVFQAFEELKPLCDEVSPL